MTLRIATAGSVDDGKSTLIGRLLHDTKTVFEDQLSAVERASRRYGDGSVNLALLTDGLRAEREQGITIDVAYRYFATPRRSFVVADTPGHAQYTRNMVTGASVSDVAIVLVDARNGLTEQTRRHLFVASLLRVKRVILAINKMDLVDFDQATYERVVAEVGSHVSVLPEPIDLVAIPISALHGDNVVDESERLSWYDGPSLLELLETIDVSHDVSIGGRLAVQWVIRPHGRDHHDYRGFAGRVSGGSFSVGEEVVVLPSGRRSRISGIDRGGESTDFARDGESVSIQLADDLDVGRGDVIVADTADRLPVVRDEIVADVAWMIDRPLEVGSRWAIKHQTRSARAIVTDIDFRYDVATARPEHAEQLSLNDLGRIRLATTVPFVFDAYHDHRPGGASVLIDEATGMTAAALMFRSHEA
jgi:bifunctional enzyme CysN/CysC/sulfate adenylyltransferase subunit 1